MMPFSSSRRSGRAIARSSTRSDPLIGAIDVTRMREANRRLGGGADGSPEAVARWLWNELRRTMQ